jgi:hypothetical protein
MQSIYKAKLSTALITWSFLKSLEMKLSPHLHPKTSKYIFGRNPTVSLLKQNHFILRSSSIFSANYF